MIKSIHYHSSVLFYAGQPACEEYSSENNVNVCLLRGGQTSPLAHFLNCKDLSGGELDQNQISETLHRCQRI